MIAISLSIEYLQILLLLVLHTFPNHVQSMHEGSMIECHTSGTDYASTVNHFKQTDGVNEMPGYQNEPKMMETNTIQNLEQDVQEKASDIHLSTTTRLKNTFNNISRKLRMRKPYDEVAEDRVQELHASWTSLKLFSEEQELLSIDANVKKFAQDLLVLQQILFQQVRDKFIHLGVKPSIIQFFGPSKIQYERLIFGGIQPVLNQSPTPEIHILETDYLDTLKDLFQRLALLRNKTKNPQHKQEDNFLMVLQEEIINLLRYMKKCKLTTKKKLINFFKDDDTLGVTILNTCSHHFQYVLRFESNSSMPNEIISKFLTLDILDGILTKEQKRKIPYYFLKAQNIAWSRSWNINQESFDVVTPDETKIENEFSALMTKAFEEDKLLKYLEVVRPVLKDKSSSTSKTQISVQSSPLVGIIFSDKINPFDKPQITFINDFFSKASIIHPKVYVDGITTMFDSRNDFRYSFISSLQSWVKEFYITT